MLGDSGVEAPAAMVSFLRQPRPRHPRFSGRGTVALPVCFGTGHPLWPALARERAACVSHIRACLPEVSRRKRSSSVSGVHAAVLRSFGVVPQLDKGSGPPQFGVPHHQPALFRCLPSGRAVPEVAVVAHRLLAWCSGPRGCSRHGTLDRFLPQFVARWVLSVASRCPLGCHSTIC